jgi:hypothetical protein
VFDTRERSAREIAPRIAGRVDAPAGLTSFVVNARTIEVDEKGFFDFEAAGATRFEMQATDRAGKIGRLTHPGRASGPPSIATQVDFGDYHALVIGNADYVEYDDLKTPAADALAVYEVLKERYGFNVTLMTDATHVEILTGLRELQQQLGEEDNLLIYFAGHGELDKATKDGYWLPVDAVKDPTKRTNWLSSRVIRDWLSNIPARHVLVVADSCYSGWLTASSVPRPPESGDPKERKRYFEEMVAKRSRIGLTSGGLRPVLDAGGGENSVFASVLTGLLSNNTDVLDTRALYGDLKDLMGYQMQRLNRTQVPEYNPIRGAGHASGDFFFVPRETAVAGALGPR